MEARKAAVVEIKGLKCDTPGCGYEQDYPRSGDEGGYDGWVNAPCPWCGASLLTPEDLTTTKRLLAFVRVLNALCAPLIWLRIIKPEYVSYELGMDGSGKLNPTKIENE
jgi:hypothetical protein